MGEILRLLQAAEKLAKQLFNNSCQIEELLGRTADS